MNALEMIIGGVLGAILMAVVAMNKIERLNEEWRNQAVSRGVAEWVVDQKTGETEWRWKP